MNVSRPHIYIIDDDESFGRSLTRLLRTQGFKAEYFPSAATFLDAHPSCKEKAFAIVDINMPQCDGFMLMDKMKDQGCTTPVIVITGKPQANSRALSLQKGAVGYLEKPFGVGSLLQLIHPTEKIVMEV